MRAIACMMNQLSRKTGTNAGVFQLLLHDSGLRGKLSFDGATLISHSLSKKGECGNEWLLVDLH